jgi:glycosyltransferase involved in cell wall biosynthesis
MAYVFLTACRNEELILDEFLAEFTEMVGIAGIAEKTTLYIVDDLSTDRSREILERYASESRSVKLHTISVPTNFGNQGAMFYGLGRIKVGPDDVLVTFDCDGEDDVREIPSILELGAKNPGKAVLIERGQRAEPLSFKIFFAAYKILFRLLTRQRVVPNNFMLIPARFVPVIQRSPLAAVHLAYAILKLNPPRVVTTRNRRPRYGGRTSQNLFMLVSHGMVGLMVFYEIVIAKLFLLLFVSGGLALAIVGAAMVVPASDVSAQHTLVWTAIGAGIGAVAQFSLLLSAALALVFKLLIFTLGRTSDEPRGGRTPQEATASSERDTAPVETADKRAR